MKMLYFPSKNLLNRYAPLKPVLQCSRILAHQSNNTFALWEACEDESCKECDVPFWAIVWPGALSLSKYLLQNPHLIKNKTVLDFGCGSGIVSIAARLAGAHTAIANDIDPIALYITQLNASANGITVKTSNKNLLKESQDEKFDIILVSDMFYQNHQSRQILTFLKKERSNGATVIIADGERTFAPQTDIKIIWEERIAVNRDLEGVDERLVRLSCLT